MGFSLVQSIYQKFTFANPVITLSGAPTAGNTLVVFFGGTVGGAHPIDTTKWAVNATDGNASSGNYHVLSRVVVSGDGATLPAFLSSSDTGGTYYVIVAEFNHTGGQIVFDTATAYTGSSPVTGPASTQNDELAVMMQFQGSGFGAWTPGSGYTNIRNDANWSSAADYKILATSGSSSSASPTWSAGGSSAHYFTSLWKVLAPPDGNAAQVFTGISQAALAGAGSIGDISQTFAGISQAMTGEAVPPPTRVTQGVRLSLVDGHYPERVTQGARLTLVRVATPERVTSGVRLSVIAGRYPLRLTQGVRLALVGAVPCVTYWQQLWTITRRDGQVFRFTSLDRDFQWWGYTYKTCGSLMPSASEESSEMGSVASIELKGILSDESITGGDLYGGLFDDAFVTIWLVPFQGAETPRRLAAGWIGGVQHGEQGWTGEITGPGARLDQQALVAPYAPACRWTFGDSRCTKDLTALQTAGQVLEASNRGVFVSDAPEPGFGSQWENGRVIWQTGRNAGITCEIKTADFGGSADTQIVLWALAPFLPEPGDTFIMQPGCDLSPGTCKNVYSNLINFGGFKDVPGNDSIAETPIAKIDS